jgi:hypothetical protein
LGCGLLLGWRWAGAQRARGAGLLGRTSPVRSGGLFPFFSIFCFLFPILVLGL